MANQNQFERMWTEVAIAYFEVSLRSQPGETEKITKYWPRWPVTRQRLPGNETQVPFDIYIIPILGA
jgi:hypothetical protein